MCMLVCIFFLCEVHFRLHELPPVSQGRETVLPGSGWEVVSASDTLLNTALRCVLLNWLVLDWGAHIYQRLSAGRLSHTDVQEILKDL